MINCIKAPLTLTSSGTVKAPTDRPAGSSYTKEKISAELIFTEREETWHSGKI